MGARPTLGRDKKMFSQCEGSWMVLPNGKQTRIKTKRFIIEGTSKKQANTKKGT
jgi:hypothetical protein